MAITMKIKNTHESMYTEAVPRFATAYGPHPRVHTPIVGESRTKQSFKEECDINSILDRFRATGELTHVSENIPKFVDVMDVPDFKTAMDQVRETERLFLQLDAPTRARFGNDPAELLDFMVDPSNAAELHELGLGPAPESLEDDIPDPEPAPPAPPAPDELE